MSRNSLPKNLKNDARGLTLKAFRALRQGKTGQEALDGALAGSSLPQAEKNLASELFYGVCRNRIRLDYIANKFLAKPASLPAAMQDILNIALYSLLFQQKIPAYAAINSAVEQVSQSYGKLSAVANGFLRNAQIRPGMKTAHLPGRPSITAYLCWLPNSGKALMALKTP